MSAFEYLVLLANNSVYAIVFVFKASFSVLVEAEDLVE